MIGRIELNGGFSTLVSILDSAPGNPPLKLAESLDPFFTTKEQGMGIGLFIARPIVQTHRARTWEENELELLV